MTPRPAVDTVAALAATEVFGVLHRDALTELAARTRPRILRRGERLFFPGDPGDALFVVVSGRIKVVVESEDGATVVLATLTPPAVFGETAVLDGGPRSAGAEAVDPTTVLALSRDALMEVMGRVPELADVLFRAIGTIVRRLTEHTSDLVFLDLPGRVAKSVVSLATTDGDGPAVLRMTQSDLAGLVGGSRQSVNQALATFERLGYLRVDGRAVEVLKPELLARRAGIS